MNKKIYTNFNATIKDLGEGKLEAIVSTDDVDRHGEIVDIDGISLDNYEKNPVVMWAHDYSLPPIAKTLEIKKVKKGKKMLLVAVMEFATTISDLAREVYNLYKGGFLNTFSIGFIPDYDAIQENRYLKSELLEYSAVPIPANPNALLLAKAKGLDTSILDSYTLAMNIQNILQKEVGDLTLNEVEILKSNVSELTDEQKEKFASVLVEKDANEDILTKMDEKLNAFGDKLKKELDPVNVKDINGKMDINKSVEDLTQLSKEEKFKLYVIGLSTGNLSKYKSAMNTTDDSAVLPPTEFIAEVERLEEKYGVARRFAQVRTSTRSSMTLLVGGDDVEIFDTSEGGQKQSSVNSYLPIQILWRKFAGILPITDELEEESAVDLWNDAVNRFARAFAKKEDELVFTESSAVSPKNKGIMEISGTKVVTITGDSIEDLSYDDLSKMIYGVPTDSEVNGRFWLNREILGVIQRIKDNDGRPVWQRAMADGTPSTILGKPYEFVEVLPNLAADAPGKAMLCFGDLKYVTLGDRTGLKIDIFNSGIVGDPDEVTQGDDLNLITKDMKAMRAVKRMNAKVRFPKAFAVCKVGTSAS